MSYAIKINNNDNINLPLSDEVYTKDQTDTLIDAVEIKIDNVKETLSGSLNLSSIYSEIRWTEGSIPAGLTIESASYTYNRKSKKGTIDISFVNYNEFTIFNTDGIFIFSHRPNYYDPHIGLPLNDIFNILKPILGVPDSSQEKPLSLKTTFGNINYDYSPHEVQSDYINTIVKYDEVSNWIITSFYYTPSIWGLSQMVKGETGYDYANDTSICLITDKIMLHLEFELI